MPVARYIGTFAVTYPDFVDAATGRTLEAQPGGTYDVQPAPGRNPGQPAMPNDGRWAPAPPADWFGELADDPPAEPATELSPPPQDAEPETTTAPAEGAASSESEA